MKIREKLCIKGKDNGKRDFSFFLLLITIAIFLAQNIFPFSDKMDFKISAQTISNVNDEIKVPKTFKAPTITAQYAVLIDSQTGQILYKKNANDKAFPASITKIMTGLLAVENLKDDDIITMSHDAVYSVERGSSHIALQVGEQITVSQALHALLLVSANDAANGLAEKVSGNLEIFADLMTKRAIELGAKNTNFVNANGLPDDMHYTTAYDMAIITRHAITNSRFKEYFSKIQYTMLPTNLQNQSRNFFTHHKMLYNTRYQYNYAFAGKTGYTSKAGSTLVTVAKKDNHELICVTMKESAGEAYYDAKSLFEYGFSQFEPITISKSLYDNKKIDAIKENKIIGTAKLINSEDKILWVPNGSNILADAINIDLPASMQSDKIESENIIINAKVSTLNTTFYESFIDIPVKTTLVLNNISSGNVSESNENTSNNITNSDLIFKIVKILLIILIAFIGAYLLYVLIMIFRLGYYKKLIHRFKKKFRKLFRFKNNNSRNLEKHKNTKHEIQYDKEHEGFKHRDRKNHDMKYHDIKHQDRKNHDMKHQDRNNHDINHQDMMQQGGIYHDKKQHSKNNYDNKSIENDSFIDDSQENLHKTHKVRRTNIENIDN